MSDSAIRVENLSKRYRIGLKEEVSDTFVGAISSFVRNPLTNLRRLRRLSSFNEDGIESEDILWALRDVSFEVKKGEVLGIIGRNGAGKSTLLKVLSKITHPTKGRVELNGRVASLLEVGTGFHPELTGRENIYLNGTILGMTKKEIDHKLEAIIDFSGVEKFIDTPVKRYSSGMRVRLAFSVAAHLEPEILLIDEVLAVGDIEFQKRCLGKMDEVAKGGRTVLFVSHNLGAILSLCQTAVCLDSGKIIAAGEVGGVVTTYLDRQTLLGSASSEQVDGFNFNFVTIENAADNQISFDQPIDVKIGFSVSDGVSQLRMTFMLFDNKGNRIIHVYEDLINLKEDGIRPGSYLVTVAFPPLWLSPDFYSAEVVFKIIGEGKIDGNYTAPTTKILVSGDEKRFDNLLSPKVVWNVHPTQETIQ